MFVKSLTLKGFKSFASATSMRLEPGITCIVGPNGSGKSNVVDALAWVMGEQGAKSLRGGKMEDVIFAGTAGRPPLGRAEVTMTIDNTDGALPIDYAEVTISRTMFRGGGSEYAINGTGCRLLDIQELLSDSGIGHEMHVIVGQGRLDDVLRATPEERRGFVEEAAGVLKHRKRKERALRKLDQMEGNLTRVADLTNELRRQLGPLGRQAETARRATVIQAEVRDARGRLLADDIVLLTSALEQELADESAMLRRREAVEATLAAVRAEIADLEQRAAEAAPELELAQDQWFALSSLRDRVAATRSLAAERVRLMTREQEEERHAPGSGRDPDRLRAQAAEARATEKDLARQLSEARTGLTTAVAEREAAELAHHEENQRLARLARAAADRREGLAKLAGQVAALRSRVEAGEAEVGRLRETLGSAGERAAKAENEYRELEGSVAAVEEDEVGLDAAYEAADEQVTALTTELDAAREAVRAAETERVGVAARLDALRAALRRRDGGGDLLASDLDGVRGTLAGLVGVAAGHEAAVAAALGHAADAVVVASAPDARAALDFLRDGDRGRATLALPGPAVPRAGRPDVPGTWALDVVTVTDETRAAVEALLRDVVLVAGPDDVAAVVAAGLVAVLPDGELHGPGWVRGGSADAPSALETQAAADETQARLDEITARLEQARFAVAALQPRLKEARAAADEALDALNESDARMNAVAERLAQLGAQLRAGRNESERTTRALTEAERALEERRTQLTELAARHEAAQAEPTETEPSTEERERLAVVAAQARSTETELRLSVRTLEERARSAKGRAESLEASARNEIAAREKAAARRLRRERDLAAARSVQSGAEYLGLCLGDLVEVAAARRAAATQRRKEQEAALAAARGRHSQVADELRELTDSVHKDEIARAEQRLRIEALRQRAIDEMGTDPDQLVEELGPHQLVPAIPGPGDDPDVMPDPRPYVREEQEKRLRTAERKLASLGRINPLALEEFAALEERHTFLSQQLEDLRRSKRDLLDIVAEVDERVQRVFSEAYEDTAAQFERVFDRLFPGGEGRLVLTDPSDMLTTGIEVEARPPGKKVKRLSLLSGGERSLVAVALLVAIFKARPSPFYIMDEVEAALDDTNLGRLITLFEELRDSSQLIVITHQKRTMEVADSLYGISMQGDGVTTVVSQRLRDVDPRAMSTR